MIFNFIGENLRNPWIRLSIFTGSKPSSLPSPKRRRDLLFLWEKIEVRVIRWLRVFAFCSLMLVGPIATAQTPQLASTPSATPITDEETIVPTFETQKLARTYALDIPAPRGQITDRTGLPLAQNKVSYNLAVSFPTPLDFTDAKAVGFAREKIDKAAKVTGRAIKISDEVILRHYHNRGILPLEIAQNLSKSEYEAVKDRLKDFLVVRPIYVRTYPNGKVAGQIIGYTGKTGRNLDGIIDNHETLWPETEGRDGLEQTFNEMLTGKPGEYKLTFDKDGRKTSEKLVKSAVPGNNVITTLDLQLQQLAEKALESKAKRGAIVIVDPTHGDILAFRPRNSSSYKTIRTFHFWRVRFVRRIRRGQLSKSRLESPRSRPARFMRTISINAYREFRLAISLFTIGKKAIAARSILFRR